MRSFFLAIIAFAAIVLTSCSNKVDLYADEGEHTIVYAVLDPGLDTNYFKITKSFLGNAQELAQNYDANNYKYDELEVKFSGNFIDQILPNGQIISSYYSLTLDTISRWIPYDANSTFYSGCWQTYYYTTKKLMEDEEYTLEILRKTDNVTIKSKAKTINNFYFKKPGEGHKIEFKDLNRGTVEWKAKGSVSTAAFFEVTAFFHYKELMPGATDTVWRSIKWYFGANKAENLFVQNDLIPHYAIGYVPKTLYNILSEDEYLLNNSPTGVQRWIEKFEIQITAIGDILYNYYLVTNSSSAIQDVPNYSNIENGKGIMSTRITKSIRNKVGERSREKIHDDYRYGFIYEPDK